MIFLAGGIPVGLHYLLVHYDIPAVDPATWSLRVDGAVARPLTFELAALRDRPQRTVVVTLECAGNGRARLAPRPVSQPWLTEAVQHGFPVRLVVPGWYGMAHVKWLRAVTVTAEPFTGFQNAVAYGFKEHPDGAGEPVTRIRPRALMIPPGYPDFMSRTRFVDAGEHLLEGRAWSGCAAVVRVEVSTDGGGTWGDADLGPALGRWAWSRWTYRWRAGEPGRYELLARAHDADGHVQPVDQPWNVQGMANNMAQRVSVVVAGAAARRRTPRPPV